MYRLGSAGTGTFGGAYDAWRDVRAACKVKRLREEIAQVRIIVGEQANDADLWLTAQTPPRLHLAAKLRSVACCLDVAAAAMSLSDALTGSVES